MVHVDMDGFYASVGSAIIRLRRKPIAIGGSAPAA
ncbi:hypothetical protein RLEG12_09320 (plasmid) [Rhizobium leguminosarum bv. trifolii CB782]|nr:hypothetical protein RLEG12_09320 [Rhizobium leguminosarum bv. trifolii CB782]